MAEENNPTKNGDTKQPESQPKEKKPEDRQTGKKDKYAYTIKDKSFGEFKVLNSANAWWLDTTKVQKLIDAYKIDANDDEACFYAGISLRNLQYFKELHPQFLLVKHACSQNLGIIAKKNFAKNVEENRDGASLEYLRMKRKDEGYSTRVEQTGANGRDLFDSHTKKLNDLIEELENDGPNEDTTTKKHPGSSSGDSDAGQNGDRDDATASGDKPKGQEDAPAPSKPIQN